MPSRKDPVREISHVVVYAVFYHGAAVPGLRLSDAGVGGDFCGDDAGEPRGGALRQLAGA